MLKLEEEKLDDYPCITSGERLIDED